jgi:predicted amidohydrolase YtcJ
VAGKDAAPIRHWIANAEVDDSITTILVESGRIASVASNLAPESDDEVFDAQGGAVLPGLADHHIHLFALAAARHSIDVSGVTDLDTFGVPVGPGWLRAIGASRTWTRRELDRAFADRPTRVQHRSGAPWMLNSAAVDRLGPELTYTERESGWVWRDDARIRAALADSGERGVSADELAALGRELAALGVTGLTDATPTLDEAGLGLLRSAMPQEIGSLSSEVASPLPMKIVIADAHPPDFDALVAQFVAARDSGRAVAAHAVSSAALAMAIAAFDIVGAVPEDRIEHAAVCTDLAADRLAQLGVTVVTQPGLWRRRRSEFVDESEPSDVADLWRHGSLQRRGVRVAVGSDAPFGDRDPWQAVHDAATRPPVPAGSDESVPPQSVLASLLAEAGDPAGTPRAVRVGAPADLVVLDGPRDTVLAQLQQTPRKPVRATLVGGSYCHRSGGAHIAGR